MRSDRITRSRWWMPAFSVLLGLLVLAAFTIGGDAWSGVAGLGVMTAFGAIFLLGGRSETLRGLGGPGRDERWAMIDLRASNFAGMVLLTACTGAWLYALAQGESGNPYGVLMAIAGVAYLAAVAVLRVRA